jgi:hypothetical protein
MPVEDTRNHERNLNPVLKHKPRLVADLFLNETVSM